MCGIILELNKTGKPVNSLIRERFQDQISRGKEGLGCVFMNKLKNGNTSKRKISIHRSTEPLDMLVELAISKSDCILLHHRIPTSSSNRISQTHPIDIGKNDDFMKHRYLIVHNGIISNKKEVKKDHEEMEIKYTTEVTKKYALKESDKEWNDSEALAWEIALACEDEKAETLRTEGSAAFIAIKIDKQTNQATSIIWGRNSGNPLKIRKDENSLGLSSEGPGENVETNIIFEYDMETEKITERKIEIPTTTKYEYLETNNKKGKTLTYNEVNKIKENDKKTSNQSTQSTHKNLKTKIKEEIEEEEEEYEEYEDIKLINLLEDIEFTVKYYASTLNSNTQIVTTANNQEYSLEEVSEEIKKLIENYTNKTLRDQARNYYREMYKHNKY